MCTLSNGFLIPPKKRDSFVLFVRVCSSFARCVWNVRLHMARPIAWLSVPVKMISTFHAGSKMFPFLLMWFFFLSFLFFFRFHCFLPLSSPTKIKNNVNPAIFVRSFFSECIVCDELWAYILSKKLRSRKSVQTRKWCWAEVRELDTFFVKRVSKIGKKKKTRWQRSMRGEWTRIGAFTNELFLCHKHTYTLALSAPNIFHRIPHVYRWLREICSRENPNTRCFYCLCTSRVLCACTTHTDRLLCTHPFH